MSSGKWPNGISAGFFMSWNAFGEFTWRCVDWFHLKIFGSPMNLADRQPLHLIEQKVYENPFKVSTLKRFVGS